MNFLSMDNYSVPEVLYNIGIDNEERVIKASSGVRISDLKDLGFSGVNDNSIMMQWGMEAFSNNEVINNTLDAIKTYGMFTNSFLNDLSDINLNVLEKTGILPTLVKHINPQTDGIAIQQANTYTYKNNDYILATAMSYLPGSFADQHHIQSATLSHDLSVYNTHPAISEGKSGLNGNSPTYWTGYGYFQMQYRIKILL